MITITQCITSARFAADAVWGQIGPGGFSWIECLTANRFQARLARKADISPGIGCVALAQYITNNRGATAEQLFRFAIADHTDPASWDRAPPSLRAAVEIFRATFLVLLQLHEADAREKPKEVMHGQIRQVAMRAHTHSAREAELARGQGEKKASVGPSDPVLASDRAKVAQPTKQIWDAHALGPIAPPLTPLVSTPAPDACGHPKAHAPGAVSAPEGASKNNIIPILEERGRKYPRRNPTGGKA